MAVKFSVFADLVSTTDNIYVYTPVIYTTGSFGGVGAAIQLHAFLSEMGIPTISNIFAISKIGDSLHEAGASQEAALTKRIGQFLDELLKWYEE
ncbi:hypothetical protein [Nostoc sp. DedQUE08]|uniref:hypothetical protein n=1 Tax=Nostoc sp. DedQUE08 TaxID=3075393 RepID=UPI002AD37045|nr:hypothetical protein [Nostoc sp. DedQUE08]